MNRFHFIYKWISIVYKLVTVKLMDCFNEELNAKPEGGEVDGV